MSLILKLLLFLVAFLFIRRAIGGLLSPKPSAPPPRDRRQDPPQGEDASGKHPAIGEDEVIEEGEFEELD